MVADPPHSEVGVGRLAVLLLAAHLPPHPHPSEPSAYVDMVNHVVVCNPEYPYPPLHLARHVRGLPADLHEFQQTYLESLIAHEAGHTHHSGLLPAGLHGQLVNMLEDERMERLTAVDFPHLTALFQLAADVDAAHAIEQGGLGGDVLRGCLLHRFTCHHPIWSFTPDQADAGLWPEVKAIVEEAWVAPRTTRSSTPPGASCRS